MNRYMVLLGIALAALASSGAAAQSAKDLVGTWTLVSADAFGSNPKGYVMFDANGRVSAVLMRSDLPKYASNNRSQGTAEENKATVQGMIAWFGTYSVSGTDLILHIEGSSFPNWNGSNQKRTNLSVSGDELKWTQPTPSQGGPPVVVVWKRAK
jgi:Lipocalin-like domain